MSPGRFHNPYFHHPSPRQQLWQRDGWAVLGSIVLGGVLLWYVFGYRQVLSADAITISGQQYLTVDQIADATRQALQQRRWLVFKQRWLPVLDETQLTADITTELARYVQVESVTITTAWPDTVQVQVVERVPGYVYIVGKDYYYLDVHGYITQSVAETKADPHFPHIRERNKKRAVAVSAAMFQTSLMNFISNLHSQFTPATQLDIAEYAILPVTCQTKQYVTDKIFADEIAGSKTESAKEKKRAILDQLQNDTITVDQSLDLLEEIKRQETGEGNPTTGNEAFIQWETEYASVPCDYWTVVRDVAVITQQGVAIYFDTSLDLTQQLTNLKTVLSSASVTPQDLEYIDVRFTDRAYYK